MSKSKGRADKGTRHLHSDSFWESKYEEVKKELANDEFAIKRFNTVVRSVEAFQVYWDVNGGNQDKFIQSFKYTVSLSTARAEVEMLRTLNEQRIKDGRELIDIPKMKDIRHMSTHELIDALGISDEIIAQRKAIKESLLAKGYSLAEANKAASEWISQNWFGSL